MEDLCRTCGEIPQNPHVRNIFKEVVLLKLIKEFTGLWLRNDEKLPVCICNRCHNMLKGMCNFRQRCTLVQNFFTYRKSKESKSIKVRSKTNKIDQPANLEDFKSEKYLGDDIDSDKHISIDLEDSDEEEKYKQQEDLIGHYKKYNSTQDFVNEFTYSVTLESSEEVGNGIDDGENEQMATSENSLRIDEFELVDKDADEDEIDMECNSIPDEINEPVTDKGQNKSNGGRNFERNSICEICGKMFTSKANLKQHRYIHNSIKAFKCSTCNKAFHTSYELKKHERIHSENHPYVCSFCSAKFSYASAKIRHEKIHTNERPHKCSYCDKAFIDSGSLKNHETTHTRIRKYHCGICGHWAFTRNHLRIHYSTKTHKRNEYEHNLRLQKNKLEDPNHSQKDLPLVGQNTLKKDVTA